MVHWMRVLRNAAAGLSLLLLGSACGPAPAPGAKPIVAVASVPPLGWLLQQVGGEGVAVQVLIPSGRSPHGFEPTPGDVRGLGRAEFCLRVGHPDFGFEERLLEPLSRRQPPVPTVRLDQLAGAAGVSLQGDPHLWLSLPLMAEAATRVADTLAELDPSRASGYKLRGEALRQRLLDLDQSLRERMAGAPCKTFLVDHAAWGAFADRYGLRQLTLEIDGKAAGPASLVGVIEAAKEARIRVVLVEPGQPQGSGQTVARTLGAVVEVLDPLAPEVPVNVERAAELVAQSCGDV